MAVRIEKLEVVGVEAVEIVFAVIGSVASANLMVKEY